MRIGKGRPTDISMKKGEANISYPYPIIREYKDDYSNTNFIGKLKVFPKSGWVDYCARFL